MGRSSGAKVWPAHAPGLFAVLSVTQSTGEIARPSLSPPLWGRIVPAPPPPVWSPRSFHTPLTPLSVVRSLDLARQDAQIAQLQAQVNAFKIPAHHSMTRNNYSEQARSQDLRFTVGRAHLGTPSRSEMGSRGSSRGGSRGGTPMYSNMSNSIVVPKLPKWVSGRDTSLPYARM